MLSFHLPPNTVDLTRQLHAFFNMSIVRNIFIGCGVIVSSFLTALYVLQEKILYLPLLPSRQYERTPQDYRLPFEDVEIRTDDDVTIHAWLITQAQNPKNSPTLIYFHGNAGNISHRLLDARFQHASGFNILMVSYRGYGQSNGSPSEKGLKKDALAALEYLLDRDDVINTEKIYVFGRSIGGACAIALAASELGKQKLKGLILENTFTSINDMIDAVLPVLKFAKSLNRNRWDSQNAIKDITAPMLFLSGLKDELVPPQHTIKLIDAAVKARFKKLFTVQNGGHNDTWRIGAGDYRAAINDFIQHVEKDDVDQESS